MICERFGKTATRYTDDPHYAPQQIMINRCEVVENGRGAVLKDVRDALIRNSDFKNRQSDVITLRCADEVIIENTRLSKPVQRTNVPEEVPIL